MGESVDAEKPQALRFPPSIKYIVFNEFCTRYTYFGIRVILALYARKKLGLSSIFATELIALLISASYVTPLLGAYLSDAIIVRKIATF